jgi:hypothetical protein
MGELALVGLVPRHREGPLSAANRASPLRLLMAPRGDPVGRNALAARKVVPSRLFGRCADGVLVKLFFSFIIFIVAHNKLRVIYSGGCRRSRCALALGGSRARGRCRGCGSVKSPHGRVQPTACSDVTCRRVCGFGLLAATVRGRPRLLFRRSSNGISVCLVEILSHTVHTMRTDVARTRYRSSGKMTWRQKWWMRW